MKKRTLLLNLGYMPIKSISWKRAICMFFLGKVDVLETYDWKISSPSCEFPAPAVIKLKTAVNSGPMRIKFSRANIYSRDKKTCQYCGKITSIKDLTLDHVVPKSMGGRTTWTNIVACCKLCNSQKADKTPKQADMKLLSKPSYPNMKTFYQNYSSESIPEQWNNWLY